MPPKKPKYTHLSQRNQILKRPGQHIGSVKTVAQAVWLAQTEYDAETEAEVEHIVKREIQYNPGLLHIFYEALSNAQDNYFNSKSTATPQKKIAVTVDAESGRITIWNDGQAIPTVIHEWGDDEDVVAGDHYETEIIFGHLNSSGNYDDGEGNERQGAGLHGVGIKLTNIFSTEFKVESFDPETGQKFAATWSDNMAEMSKPKITKLKSKKGYTQISYIADFKRFGLSGYSEDLISVMKKLCVDCAMVTGQKVYFNDELIPVKNLIEYAKAYNSPNTKCIEFKSEDSTVVICEKPEYEPGIVQVSFVNGVNTCKGGVHVKAWTEAIYKPLIDKISAKFDSKKKAFKLTPKMIEQYFMIFINCNLLNPNFIGQTKEILSDPTPKINVPPSKIASIMKWDFIDNIEETIRVQELKQLDKTNGTKSTSVSIKKAIDANKAGTKDSANCTLIITEGDSAKGFAITGIGAIEGGTNWFGVMPIRGKMLNVRGAPVTQINDNKEITNLKKMLGLKHGVDYTTVEGSKNLRYGNVLILTDADQDGDHIKGLVINFFQYFYPTLISKNFLGSLRTPIVKAYIGKKVITFYYLKDFKIWASKQKQKFTTKYYKGLGTSKDEEIIEIFEDPHNICYVGDKKAADTVDMVFSKERANDRKKWLENFVEKDFVYKQKDDIEQVPISEFFNNEMISFSIYDNTRSIPSVVDGLKTSQRKAMWAALHLLNQTSELKVAQFAGKAAEKSAYHHGEKSLEETIVGLAQTFVGANNVALLFPSGHFGTRLEGGKDAADGRYIYTRLSGITRFVFRKEDDPILNYLSDDGEQIEPTFFVPVIPILLANGAHGIGTGYSTDIPAYNPLELVDWIKLWLEDGGDGGDGHDNNYPELTPWYFGFKGRTVQDPKNDKKYWYYGDFKKTGKDCYEITELPINVWTSDYNEQLNALKNGISSTNKNAKAAKTGYELLNSTQLKAELKEREQSCTGTKKVLVDRLKAYDKENGTKPKKTDNANVLISKWEWYGDNYNVKYTVWTKPGVELDYDNPKFKLTSCESTTNMTAFTPTGGIKKYETLNDILHTFCTVRFEYYQLRKKHLIKFLEDSLAEEEAKARFIAEALDDFEILRRSEEELFEYFDEQGYWKKNDSYTFLTSMQIRTFTADKYAALLKEIEATKKKIDYIKKKTPKQMWLSELDEFTVAYKKWIKEIEDHHIKMAKKKIKKFGKKNVKK